MKINSPQLPPTQRNKKTKIKLVPYENGGEQVS